MSRTLGDIAGEFSDRVRIATINHDEEPATGRAYRVVSLPTLLMFRAGGIVGARPKSRLREMIGTYASL